MKLATWNCCGKFDTNLHHLLGLGIDVAVACEAVAPTTWPRTVDGRAITGFSRRVWSESWKELAVLACAPWSVGLHEEASSAPDWTLPVRVDGPATFVLVGLWPVKFAGSLDYVPQIDGAVDWIKKAIGDQPVVLAGDFNAPIQSSRAPYQRVANRLEELRLVDVYHAARRVTAGVEPEEATYYHQRRREAPFHIDHVFMPSAWAELASVEVGDYDVWVGSGRSDHVPVTVDLPAAEMR